MGKSTPW